MQVGEEVVEGDQTKEFLVSGSRDKSIMIWEIVERQEQDEEDQWGYPRKILKGKLPLRLKRAFFRTRTLHQRPLSVSG